MGRPKIILHTMAAAAAAVLTFAIPFGFTDYCYALLRGELDAVSAATAAVDMPGGEFVVMINTDKHPDKANLAVWEEFFGGGETDFIFEDITCTVASSDSTAFTTAQSFQARLPENQMKIIKEDPTLMLSKADNGRFDIIIMSAESAKALGAQSVSKRAGTETIHIKGEVNEEA